MTFSKTKKIAAVAVAMMGIAFLPSIANAQTATIQASITTDAAIDVVDGDDMDFGTWLLIHRNSDDFELVMDTAGAITTANLAGGAGDSVAQELTSVDQAATVTVDLPTGASNVELALTRTAITNVAGDLDGDGSTALTLQDITYSTATETGNNTLAESTPEVVTVVAGGTPETVSFGGTIAVSGQPNDTTHTAAFDVTFAY